MRKRGRAAAAAPTPAKDAVTKPQHQEADKEAAAGLASSWSSLEKGPIFVDNDDRAEPTSSAKLDGATNKANSARVSSTPSSRTSSGKDKSKSTSKVSGDQELTLNDAEIPPSYPENSGEVQQNRDTPKSKKKAKSKRAAKQAQRERAGSLSAKETLVSSSSSPSSPSSALSPLQNNAVQESRTIDVSSRAEPLTQPDSPSQIDKASDVTKTTGMSSKVSSPNGKAAARTKTRNGSQTAALHTQEQREGRGARCARSGSEGDNSRGKTRGQASTTDAHPEQEKGVLNNSGNTDSVKDAEESDSLDPGSRRQSQKRFERITNRRARRALRETPLRSLERISRRWKIADGLGKLQTPKQDELDSKASKTLLAREDSDDSLSDASALSLADVAPGERFRPDLDAEASDSSLGWTDDDYSRQRIAKAVATQSKQGGYMSGVATKAINLAPKSRQVRRMLRGRRFTSGVSEERFKKICTERRARMLAKPTVLRKHRRKVLRAPHLDPKDMIGVDALRTFPGVSNGIPCRIVGHHITKGYTVEFSDGEQEVVKDANELRVLSALPLENIKRKRDGGDTRQEDATLFRMAPYQGITWKPKERDDIEVYMDALQIVCDRQVVLVRSKRSFVKTFGRSDFPGRMRGSQSMRTGGIATSSNSSWRAYVREAELGRAQQIAWDCIRRCLARVLENARIICHPDLIPDSHSIVDAAEDEDLGFSMLKTMRKLDFGGRSSIKSRRSFRKLSAEEQNRYTNLGKDLRQVVANDIKAAKKSREHVSSQLDNLFGPGPPPMLLPDSRSALKVQVHRLELAVKSIHWLYLLKLFGVTPTKTDSAFEVRRASWTLLRNSDERADLCDLAVRLKKAYILIDGECRAHLKMRQLRGAALKRLWDALDHLDDDGDFVDHAASNAIFDEITRSLGARRSWEELDSVAYHARRAEAARRALMRVFLAAEEKKLRHIIYVATYMRASKLQMEKLRAVHLDTKLVHRYAILRTEHVLKTYGARPTSLPTRNQVQTIDDALGVVYSQQGTRDWWDAAAHMDDLGCQLPISKTTEDADSQESDEAGFDSRPAAEKTVAKHPVSAEQHQSNFPSASGSPARKSVSSKQKSIFAPSSDEDDSEDNEATGLAKEKDKTKKNKEKLETRKTKRAVDSSLSAADSDDSGDEDKGEAHDSSDEEEDQLARAPKKNHPNAPGKAPKKPQPHRSTSMYDSSDEDEEDDDEGDGRKDMRSIATSNAADEDSSAAEEDSSDAEVHRLGKRKLKAAFDDSDDDDSQASHDSSSKKMDKKNKHKKELKEKKKKKKKKQKETEKKEKRRKTTDNQASPDTISSDEVMRTTKEKSKKQKKHATKNRERTESAGSSSFSSESGEDLPAAVSSQTLQYAPSPISSEGSRRSASPSMETLSKADSEASLFSSSSSEGE